MTDTILADCCRGSNHWWWRGWWWWRTWWWRWRWWCSQGRSNALLLTLGQLLVCGVIWNRVVVGTASQLLFHYSTYLQLGQAAGGPVWQSSAACGSEPRHQPSLELLPPFDQLPGSASKAAVLPAANRPSSLCCAPSLCDHLCNSQACQGKALPQREGKPHRQQLDAGQEPWIGNHQNCAHQLRPHELPLRLCQTVCSAGGAG